MTAPRKVAAPVREPGPPLTGTRIRVSLLAQDGATAAVLTPDARGPFSMSPRSWAVGHLFKVGRNYFRIQAVVHDPEDPAGVTLLVSIVRDGIVTDDGPVRT